VKLIGRKVVAIGGALLLGVVAVRNAIVVQFAEVRPDVAGRVWPGHPSSEIWSGLTQIGTSARLGKAAPSSALALIRDAAAKKPLSAEPFIVRGVQAQVAGNQRLAIEAFRTALARDHRSIPARYFLVQQYFRSGDVEGGLKELTLLARMVPNGVDSLGGYIAAYAKDPAKRPQVLALFRSDPRIERAALTVLAADPANADLILRLANPALDPPSWAPRLLESLVAAGKYAEAHSIWGQVSHVPLDSKNLIFDTTFDQAKPPAPFNWVLASSTVGLAERQSGSRLHVLFYGHDDGDLATQLLVLTPGRFRLAFRVSGDLANARALSWNLSCARSGAALLSVQLAKAAPSATFQVPSGCEGQYLKLSAAALDLPQQVDITITDLALTPEPSNG